MGSLGASCFPAAAVADCEWRAAERGGRVVQRPCGTPPWVESMGLSPARAAHRKGADQRPGGLWVHMVPSHRADASPAAAGCSGCGAPVSDQLEERGLGRCAARGRAPVVDARAQERRPRGLLPPLQVRRRLDAHPGPEDEPRHGARPQQLLRRAAGVSRGRRRACFATQSGARGGLPLGRGRTSSGGSGWSAIAVPPLARKFWTIISCGARGRAGRRRRLSRGSACKKKRRRSSRRSRGRRLAGGRWWGAPGCARGARGRP